MKYKVGDKVRVIKNINKHRYEIGSIIIIDDNENPYAYRCSQDDEGYTWYITDAEIEPVHIQEFKDKLEKLIED